MCRDDCPKLCRQKTFQVQLHKNHPSKSNSGISLWVYCSKQSRSPRQRLPEARRRRKAKVCKFVVGVEPPGMLEVPNSGGPAWLYIYTEHDEKREKLHYCKPTASDLTPQFNIQLLGWTTLLLLNTWLMLEPTLEYSATWIVLPCSILLSSKALQTVFTTYCILVYPYIGLYSLRIMIVTCFYIQQLNTVIPRQYSKFYT